jgi:hypothetical protein
MNPSEVNRQHGRDFKFFSNDIAAKAREAAEEEDFTT